LTNPAAHVPIPSKKQAELIRTHKQFSTNAEAPMKRLVANTCVVAFFALNISACRESSSPPATATKTNAPTAHVQKRAEELLKTIQTRRWSNCVDFVAVETDFESLRRMGVSTNGNSDIVSQQVGAWFKQLYDVVQPGEVMSVRFTTDNKNLALVSYMHGDLDGFPMRQIASE
jgi:hypothetical protein